MIKQLQKLEKQARALEPSPARRRKARQKVVDYTEQALADLATHPAYETGRGHNQEVWNAPIGEEPAPIEAALDLIRQNLDHTGINAASGGHLGYIPGGGLYYAALGDYIAAVRNYYAGVFFASPGAVRMENMLLRWMAGLVGFPTDAMAGNLASGGSIANLIAIVTAREAHGLRCATIPGSVVYATAHVHHCVDKALRIAGLGESVRRTVPMDERFKMDTSALERQIEADKRLGLKPFLLIASAGTTDVGAIDPLEAIAGVAQRHGLWYHIDAAYGGFFLLAETGRPRLQGLERADSVVLDPHKGLFLPYGLGVVLVKDGRKMLDAHFYAANYMQDALAVFEERSPADLSPELTKHFRGLRLWLPLKLHGLAPFRACLEEKLLLARYFHQQVGALGFETGPEPELSVVTYRFIPPHGDADAFNQRLAEALRRDGRVFVSTTVIDGKYTLRFACLSFRTHLKTVDLLLTMIKQERDNLLKIN